LDPIMDRVEMTTITVLGICDLIPTQRPEYQELVEKLALINEQMLQRVSPNVVMGGAMARMTEAVEKSAAEVAMFLNGQQDSSARSLMKGLHAPETIEGLHRRLDSVIAQFAFVHTVQIGVRLERLEDAAAHAVEVYVLLVPVDLRG